MIDDFDFLCEFEFIGVDDICEVFVFVLIELIFDVMVEFVLVKFFC